MVISSILPVGKSVLSQGKTIQPTDLDILPSDMINMLPDILPVLADMVILSASKELWSHGIATKLADLINWFGDNIAMSGGELVLFIASLVLSADRSLGHNGEIFMDGPRMFRQARHHREDAFCG